MCYNINVSKVKRRFQLMCLPTAPEHTVLPCFVAVKRKQASVEDEVINFCKALPNDKRGNSAKSTKCRNAVMRKSLEEKVLSSRNMGFSVGGLHAVLWAEGVGSSPTKSNACNMGRHPYLTAVGLKSTPLAQSALRYSAIPIGRGTLPRQTL